MHLITVGALGTLTFNVMAFSWLLRTRHDPARHSSMAWGTALLAAAVLLRLLGEVAAAALCWTAAYLLLCGLFLRNPARQRALKESGSR